VSASAARPLNTAAGMNIAHRLPFALIAGATFAAPACHSARAAETPKMVGPSVEIEIEDRSPGGGSPHSARFNVLLSSGNADINATDGDARYALSAHTITTSEPKLGLKVKRVESSPSLGLEVSAAIPQAPGGRIVVARIDRADGHVTTIIAQAR
jgi:hypothetical protein